MSLRNVTLMTLNLVGFIDLMKDASSQQMNELLEIHGECVKQILRCVKENEGQISCFDVDNCKHIDSD